MKDFDSKTVKLFPLDWVNIMEQNHLDEEVGHNAVGMH